MPSDRYTLRKEENGVWCVVDVFMDIPAEVSGQVMILMDREEAVEIVDLLNRLDRQKRRTPEH